MVVLTFTTMNSSSLITQCTLNVSLISMLHTHSSSTTNVTLHNISNWQHHHIIHFYHLKPWNMKTKQCESTFLSNALWYLEQYWFEGSQALPTWPSNSSTKMTMGHCWYNTDRGKRNHYEKSLSTINLKYNGKGPKLSLCGVWLVTICLSYGMALKTKARRKITFLPNGPNFQNSIFFKVPRLRLLGLLVRVARRRRWIRGMVGTVLPMLTLTMQAARYTTSETQNVFLSGNYPTLTSYMIWLFYTGHHCYPAEIQCDILLQQYVI